MATPRPPARYKFSFRKIYFPRVAAAAGGATICEESSSTAGVLSSQLKPPISFPFLGGPMPPILHPMIFPTAQKISAQQPLPVVGADKVPPFQQFRKKPLRQILRILRLPALLPDERMHRIQIRAYRRHNSSSFRIRRHQPQVSRPRPRPPHPLTIRPMVQSRTHDPALIQVARRSPLYIPPL